MENKLFKLFIYVGGGGGGAEGGGKFSVLSGP